MLWGGVLRGLVLKSSDSLFLPVVSFFLTGLLGTRLLLSAYYYLPSFYLDLTQHDNVILQLLGYIFQVGICEELCKIFPVVLYVIWKRKRTSPIMILLIGVFSGLGFAAFENVDYANQGMNRGVENIIETVKQLITAQNEEEIGEVVKNGGVMAILHIHGVMITTMLRSVSLVFAHAIFSGIFAYYIVYAMASGKRWAVFCCLGLAVPAVLHGIYDWLCGLQPAFAAFVICGSFILFYGYLSKIREQLKQTDFDS
jgi:RsiW-degrading membrane proteinase PrsW (M82 family)